MSIFVGTGAAEPRTLVKYLLSSNLPNLRDLEVLQLISLGDTIPLEERYVRKYRLKTFYSGWVASEAVRMGPCGPDPLPVHPDSRSDRIRRHQDRCGLYSNHRAR